MINLPLLNELAVSGGKLKHTCALNNNPSGPALNQVKTCFLVEVKNCTRLSCKTMGVIKVNSMTDIYLLHDVQQHCLVFIIYLQKKTGISIAHVKILVHSQFVGGKKCAKKGWEKMFK